MVGDVARIFILFWESQTEYDALVSRLGMASNREAPPKQSLDGAPSGVEILSGMGQPPKAAAAALLHLEGTAMQQWLTRPMALTKHNPLHPRRTLKGDTL